MFAFRGSGSRARIAVVGSLLMVGMAVGATIGHASTALRLIAAQTADNGDGYLDQIIVTASSPVTLTSPHVSNGTTPGFWVQGYNISSIVTGAQPNQIVLNLVKGATPDPANTPNVNYVAGGGVTDATGADLEATGSTPIVPADMASPVLMAMTVNDLGTARMFNTGGEEAFITFSEPVSLVGEKKIDRWSHLEAAIKFNNNGGGCAADGNGVVTSTYNFPQPSQTDDTSADPVVTPADSSTFVDTIHVRFGNHDLASSPQLFNATPTGCWVGIDTTPGAAAYLTDQAGNVAHTQAMADGTTLHQTLIKPTDAHLVSAVTQDVAGGTADGTIDAVQLTFDQRLDTARALGVLDDIHVTFGGKSAKVDTTSVDSPSNMVMILHFTPPTGEDWNSAVTPTVSYTKPSGCEATSGTPSAGALMAFLPT